MVQKEILKKNKVSVCPLCGEYDHLYVTGREEYDELYTLCNGASSVKIECSECDIVIRSYGLHSQTPEQRSYEYVLTSARHKWNKLSDRMWKVGDNG